MSKWGKASSNAGTDYRWENQLKMHALKNGEYETFRFLGDPETGARHFIQFKKKDGSQTGFYAPCFNFDPDTNQFEDKGECPACKAGLNASIFWITNVIDRSEQELMPKKTNPEPKVEHKTVEDETWSPVTVLRIPNSVATKLQKLKKLNKHRIGKSIEFFDINDCEYGVDLEVSVDKSAKPVSYDLQKGLHTPLTPEESSYLLYKLVDIIPSLSNSTKGEKHYSAKMKQAKDLVRLGLLEAPTSSTKTDTDDRMPAGSSMATADKRELESATIGGDDASFDDDVIDTSDLEAEAPIKEVKAKAKPSKAPTSSVLDGLDEELDFDFDS